MIPNVALLLETSLCSNNYLFQWVCLFQRQHTHGCVVFPKIFQKPNHLLIVLFPTRIPSGMALQSSLWQLHCRGIFSSDREAWPLQNVHCIYISLSFGWVAFQLLVLHFKPGVKNPPFCRVISHLFGVDMLHVLITKKHAEVSFIRGIQS